MVDSGPSHWILVFVSCLLDMSCSCVSPLVWYHKVTCGVNLKHWINSVWPEHGYYDLVIIHLPFSVWGFFCITCAHFLWTIYVPTFSIPSTKLLSWLGVFAAHGGVGCRWVLLIPSWGWPRPSKRTPTPRRWTWEWEPTGMTRASHSCSAVFARYNWHHFRGYQSHQGEKHLCHHRLFSYVNELKENHSTPWLDCVNF